MQNICILQRKQDATQMAKFRWTIHEQHQGIQMEETKSKIKSGDGDIFFIWGVMRVPAMDEGFVLYQLSTNEKETTNNRQKKQQLIIEAPSDLMGVQHAGI
jgi:hypothetical protein